MQLTTILLVDNPSPGASVIDERSAASLAAFIHIPEKRSSDEPVFFSMKQKVVVQQMLHYDQSYSVMEQVEAQEVHDREVGQD